MSSIRTFFSGAIQFIIVKKGKESQLFEVFAAALPTLYYRFEPKFYVDFANQKYS